jgi:hypothetical protein
LDIFCSPWLTILHEIVLSESLSLELRLLLLLLVLLDLVHNVISVTLDSNGWSLRGLDGSSRHRGLLTRLCDLSRN